MSLKLYTNKESRGVAVEWLLLELDVAYERIELEFHTEMKSPEYIAINPFGKVPTLVDGDIIIYETAAICAYLADKFIEKGLAPALNDPMRGIYYRSLFMMVNCWEIAVLHKEFFKLEIKPEQTMYVGYGNYETAYNALIRTLAEASPYLCGENFTAADVYIGGFLLYQSNLGQVKPHPTIDKYLNLIRDREMLKKSFGVL